MILVGSIGGFLLLTGAGAISGILVRFVQPQRAGSLSRLPLVAPCQLPSVLLRFELLLNELLNKIYWVNGS